MYFLKFHSNFIEKKAWNDSLKRPSNSLPDADLNLPEMKTKSPSCPSGEVHMYAPSATGIFSWKGYKHYFNQSEMLTSKVQLGYVLTGGGGQAVQGGLSCPPPRISERIDNPQILLHHLLQEYLVEIDINIISINLRCSLQRFSWVMYWQGVGGKLSRAVYLAPHPKFHRELIIPKFYYTIYYRNI